MLSINKLAKEHLLFEHIDMPIDCSNDENIDFLNNNRPNWVNRINQYDDMINDLFHHYSHRF